MSAIAVAALIGLVVGTTAGAAAGAATAACNNTDVLAGLASGALGGAILGAGAGIGALFLAPVFAGGSVAISIGGSAIALSTGAAIGTGLAIGVITGMIGGGSADLINQLWNNGGERNQVDVGSIAVTAVEYGILNMIGTGLGGTLPPDLSYAMNLLGSKLLNVLPTGWGVAIDIIRGHA